MADRLWAEYDNQRRLYVAGWDPSPEKVAAARKAIEDDIRADEAGKWREALTTALATVCRCSPPHPGPYVHKDSCPVWQYVFTAARDLLTREASGG
jgi:hypothetical protein